MSSVNVCKFLARHWSTVRTLVLKPEASVERTAVCLSVGIALGLMPLLWGTSLLCFIFAWTFGLNHILIQAMNYLLYPIQLSLLWPFFHFGAALFGISGPANSPIPADMDTAIWDVLPSIWVANLYALLLWCILATFGIPTLYTIFVFILKHYSRSSA